MSPQEGGALLVTFGDRGEEGTSSSGDVTTNTKIKTQKQIYRLLVGL